MFGVLLAKLISFLFIKGLFVPALIKRLHLTACNNGGEVYLVPEDISVMPSGTKTKREETTSLNTQNIHTGGLLQKMSKQIFQVVLEVNNGKRKQDKSTRSCILFQVLTCIYNNVDVSGCFCPEHSLFSSADTQNVK